MNPATTTAAPRPDIPEELDRLITRAIRHQENLKLSDEAFVNRYKHQLKSVDTWVRTLKKRLPDRLTPRNYEKKLADLRHLVARIDGVETQETVYDLPIIRHAEQLFDRLQGTTTDRRVGWLIGTPGTGKSVTLRHLRRRSPADTALAIVDKNWCDNRTAINTGIAEALCVPVEKNAGATWRRIIGHLQACPMTLLLDEFHEGGVLLMKIVKSLVNAAPGARIIVATIPTAYDKLIAGRNDDMVEAQQLLGRTRRPLREDWRDGIGAGDIIAYLDAAVPEFDEATRRDLAATLGPRINRSFGLRILADTIEAARDAVEDADRDLTADAVTTAFGLLTKGARPDAVRRTGVVA